MTKKIKVGIIFGGKSAEHEVSLQSGRNVCDALDREKYEPVLIGIDKSGRWLLSEESGFLLDRDDPGRIRLSPLGDGVVLAPESAGQVLPLEPGTKGRDIAIDVAFPILHGPFGEDGTIQGLLKLAGIPFVGAGVLASACGMDKDVMKRLLRDAGVPVGRFRAFRSHEITPSFGDLAAELGLPLFIKPANMGSSVGVAKVETEAEYSMAVQEAFRFDTKILVEEFIPGRELECAVLGNEQPIASVPGEVKSTHDFYSYDAKYLDENGAILEIPARVSGEISSDLRDLAVLTFKTLECEGLGRVDFFLKKNGDIIVNEINTMPGFTRISMYPKLWEASGIPYSDLISRLIDLAFKRFDKEKKLQTSVAI